MLTPGLQASQHPDWTARMQTPEHGAAWNGAGLRPWEDVNKILDGPITTAVSYIKDQPQFVQ